MKFVPKPLLKPANLEYMAVTYTCGGVVNTVPKPTIDHEGGCSCRGEGYCYCPSVTVTAEVYNCPTCGHKHSFDIG